MPNVKDITDHLAERTRPETAASWDPVGLQLGDHQAEVERVGVCHEITDAVIEAISDSPVELLLTYHPLLFAKVNRIVAGRSPESRALALARRGVAVVVTHTDFDAAPGGMAESLAAVFNLLDLEPLGANEEDGSPPIGRHGAFGETLGVLDAMATDAFGISGLRISGDQEAKLDRVAVVPGSGSDFIEEAAGVAQAVITGDVSHHRVVHALDLGLAVVDPGHIATERPGMSALLALAGTVPDIEVVDLTELDPTTWA